MNKCALLLVCLFVAAAAAARPVRAVFTPVDDGNDSISRIIGLGETVITAPVKKVFMRGDTTVVRATAYKLPEGSFLEMLVRRIPGLQYDRNTGAMTYNGVSIKGINVNGKEYFEGNMLLALKNLPAEIVAEIRIYDKTTDKERFTKMKSAEPNFVLDLRTKQEFDGLDIASASAGAGSNKKRQADFSYIKIGESGQMTNLSGGTGNKNMTSRHKGNRMDNLSASIINNVNKELVVSGNADYNGQRDGSETAGYQEKYLSSGNQYDYLYSDRSNRSHNVSGHASLLWLRENEWLLRFSAGYNGSGDKGKNSDRTAAYTSDPGLSKTNPFGDSSYGGVDKAVRLNETAQNTASKSSSRNWDISADLTRKLSEQGMSLGVTANFADTHGTNREFSVSNTTYYRLRNSLGGDSILYRNQFQNTPTRNRSGSLGMQFTIPLSGKLTAEVSYKYRVTNQRSSRSTFDLSSFYGETDGEDFYYLPEGYEKGYTDSLSNYSVSRKTGHELGVKLNYELGNIGIRSEFTVSPERQKLNQKTGVMQADTVRSAVNFNPSLALSWHKKGSLAELTYNGSTRQPELSDLMTLTDNSNPLYVTRGNPGLKASYNQAFAFTYWNHRSGISGNMSYSNTYNNQTRATFYDPNTGGVLTCPVNISGDWQANASVRYNFMAFRLVDVSLETSAEASENNGLLNEGQKEQPDRSVTRSTSCRALMTLGLNRPWGNLNASAEWNLRHFANKLQDTDNYVRDYRFSLEAFADLPCNLQVRSDTSYSFRNGTNVTPGEDNQLLWNLSVGWRFLKHKRGELSFLWSDILSDKKNFNRTVDSNGLSEIHDRQIGSYFMVTFKYSLNSVLSMPGSVIVH